MKKLLRLKGEVPRRGGGVWHKRDKHLPRLPYPAGWKSPIPPYKPLPPAAGTSSGRADHTRTLRGMF